MIAYLLCDRGLIFPIQIVSIVLVLSFLRSIRVSAFSRVN